MSRPETCRWHIYAYAKDGSGDPCYLTSCGAQVRCGGEDYVPKVCGSCGRPVERMYGLDKDKPREDQ